MYAHYDRNADIAWFLLAERDDVEVARSEESGFGLIDRDRTGAVVGLEFWEASRRLPSELLDALPEPAERARASV